MLETEVQAGRGVKGREVHGPEDSLADAVWNRNRINQVPQNSKDTQSSGY